MSEDSSPRSADSAILERLGRMWQEADPPPSGLADDLVAFVAAAGVESEWEDMHLVMSDDLAGVRARSDTETLEFELGGIALLVRIAPESSTTGRIDGWLTIEDTDVPTGTFVTLVADDGDRTTQVDDSGRFEFSGIRESPWRLRFSISGSTQLVQTPHRHW